MCVHTFPVLVKLLPYPCLRDGGRVGLPLSVGVAMGGGNYNWGYIFTHLYAWHTVFTRIVAAATINFVPSSVRLLIEGGSYSRAAIINLVRARAYTQ